MTTGYGDYEDWETGELDLVAVAAHAALEIDALERGVDVKPEALETLTDFLEHLGKSGHAAGRNPHLRHRQAVAINNAFQGSQKARDMAGVITEAAQLATQLVSAAGDGDRTKAQLRRRIRQFCVELSRAAMTPVPSGRETVERRQRFPAVP